MRSLGNHSAAESEDEVESTLLLDVVVREGPSVLQLLPSEDEPLLIRGNSLLVLRTEMLLQLSQTKQNFNDQTYLNLCFDILNGIRRLNL